LRVIFEKCDLIDVYFERRLNVMLLIKYPSIRDYMNDLITKNVIHEKKFQ
jgi:hypothetical protein